MILVGLRHLCRSLLRRFFRALRDPTPKSADVWHPAPLSMLMDSSRQALRHHVPTLSPGHAVSIAMIMI
jgi:hypothetical protein